jgi:RND family efflux transporter MFP subunit
VGTALGSGNWKWLALGFLFGLVCAGGAVAYLNWGAGSADAESQSDSASNDGSGAEHVQVVHPDRGKMPRVTRQPGTVLSFESARLHAEVSGYIKEQTVDIGSKVKRGDVLIKIDVPELEKIRDKWKATVVQADARISQAEARLKTAKAAVRAAVAKIVQANANFKSARSMRAYRNLQLQLTQDLYARRSIEENQVDIAKERFEAAVETLNAAEAAITTAEAEKEATDAKVDLAKADIEAAKADVEVAKAELAHAEVMVKFATITSPYDGFITQRSKQPGDLVKTGAEGAGNEPLLTVERTDKMRVVVQIHDRDVPFCDPGDAATVEIDALPGEKFAAKIARIAESEDPRTKLMRVEIDLPNKKGKLKQGMYGWVTIVLDPEAEQLSIPSSCLVGKSQEGKGSVYVVRDGCAKLVPVRIGSDDGQLVAIESGLNPTDKVIVQAPTSLRDGASVEVAHSEASARAP